MRDFAEAGAGLMICGFLIDLDNLPQLRRSVSLFKGEVIPKMAAAVLPKREAEQLEFKSA
jgi:hypothetical protein